MTVKNIVATLGEYEKNGEKKKQYQTIGRLIVKDDKVSIKIDNIPIGWNGWANIYDQKQKENSNSDLPF